MDALGEDAVALCDPASGDPAPDSGGNFDDFAALFDQLSKPPVFRLGNPVPEEKFMPKARIGSCPAAHNRALLD